MLALAFGLGACQSILPGDGPSRLALREKPVIASSGQRLGPDGYPLLGAYPNSATTQIDTATVQTERAGLETTGKRLAATSAASAGEYQRQVNEARAIKATQRSQTDAALAPVAGARSEPASDPDAVLREIEGR